jgi:hypothetical protein
MPRGLQLIEIFPALYGNRKFIAVFTSDRCYNPFSATGTHSTLSCKTSAIFIFPPAHLFPEWSVLSGIAIKTPLARLMLFLMFQFVVGHH